MNVRRIAKLLTPPALVDLRRQLLGRTMRYSTKARTWTDARAGSGGYSAENIFQHVLEATRSVVSGRARYERDSVLFNDTEFPFQVLTALLRVAALNEGRIQVVDFGGALGSTYRQCRPLLEGLVVDWWIIEQPSIVAAGQAEFETLQLHFAKQIDDVRYVARPSVILASSVLQYLEDPAAAILKFTNLAAGTLVIDRTPMCNHLVDRLCVQHVPKHIYQASYPCWILSHPRLLSLLREHWNILSDFACTDGQLQTDDGMQFEYRGLILERKS